MSAAKKDPSYDLLLQKIGLAEHEAEKPAERPKYFSYDDEKSRELLHQLGRLDEAMPGAQKGLLNLAYKVPPKGRAPKTLYLYRKVNKMFKSGSTLYAIAKKLKLPYSAVQKYTSMTDEEVAQLGGVVKPEKPKRPRGRPAKAKTDEKT
ncbi:MAG: hypothetical protein LBJ64_08545 [Deltaproteobacteria bacterium]|nr:hypothetical protein [Deltaproteobacteria bacterium]